MKARASATISFLFWFVLGVVFCILLYSPSTAIFAVLPLAFFLVHSREKRAWGFFLGYSAAYFKWLLSTNHLSGQSFFGLSLEPLLVYGWLTVSITYLLSFALVFWILKKTCDSHKRFLILPFAWVFAEVLWSLVLACVFFHPYVPFAGIHYTLAYIGYPLIEYGLFHPFASVGEVYLLSFLFVSIASLCAYLLAKSRYLVLFRTFVVVSAASLLSIVDIDYRTSWVSGQTGEKIQALTTENKPLPAEKAGMYVFPEDENENGIDDSTYPDTPIINGTQKGLFYSSILQENGERSLMSEKNLLVPFGEYTPWLFERISGIQIAPLAMPLEQSDPRIFMFENQRITTTLCSEIYSPFIQARKSETTDIMVFQSSLSRFNGHQSLHRDFKRMVLTRSIANDTPYVSAVREPTTVR